MSDQGFLRLRNGILEHVDEGVFHGRMRAYGLYVYLLQRRKWASGIVWTNARSISTTFGEPLSSIQEDLRFLRDRNYIQYPKGSGRRGNYPVCIINDQPTEGMLKDYRLSGFADNTFQTVIYEPINGQHTDAVLRACAGWAEDRLWAGGAHALHMPLQDIRQSRLLDSEDEREEREGADKPSSKSKGARV
jgi:hypothetical protein